jgi:hypothetical protein
MEHAEAIGLHQGGLGLLRADAFLSFPCFMALAVFGRRERAQTGICVASAILLGVSVAEWARWRWIRPGLMYGEQAQQQRIADDK